MNDFIAPVISVVDIEPLGNVHIGVGSIVNPNVPE